MNDIYFISRSAPLSCIYLYYIIHTIFRTGKILVLENQTAVCLFLGNIEIMAVKIKVYFLQVVIISRFLSPVSSFGYTFQRIDKNDDNSLIVDFTSIFHECSFESICNFVVKANKNSEMEKRQNVDDISTLLYIWKKSVAPKSKLF